MAVNFSIKNVPDELAERLRLRAARHHRSLQGELIAILEQSVAEVELLSPEQILRQVRKLGVHTAAESTKIIRMERDAR